MINVGNKITKLFLKDDSLFLATTNILNINTNNYNITRIYKTHYEFATALFANEKHLYAGFQNGQILKFDINTGNLINSFQYHNSKIHNLWVVNTPSGSDHLLFSNSADGKLIIYDIPNKVILTILDSQKSEYSFIIRSDYLYYVNDNKVIKYNYLTNKVIKHFKKYISTISCIVIKKNDLIIGFLDGKIIKLNMINYYEKYITTNYIANFIGMNNNNIFAGSKDLNYILQTNLEGDEAQIIDLQNTASDMIITNNLFIIATFDGNLRIIKLSAEEDENDFDNIVLNSSNLSSEKNYYKNDNIHCTNNNVFTLESYTKEDEPIQIYTLNNKKKFEISTCITIDELKHHLAAGKDTKYPSMIMSICTPQSHATGKIVISLPPNNIFYTYGSVQKLLYSELNKTWFALPLFGGKKRRIGNLDEAPLIGSLHCQIPGYQVYKLYSLDQIQNDLEVIETTSDYPNFLYDNIIKEFNLKEDITINFINKLIDDLIR